MREEEGLVCRVVQHDGHRLTLERRDALDGDKAAHVPHAHVTLRIERDELVVAIVRREGDDSRGVAVEGDNGLRDRERPPMDLPFYAACGNGGMRHRVREACDWLAGGGRELVAQPELPVHSQCMELEGAVSRA